MESNQKPDNITFDKLSETDHNLVHIQRNRRNGKFSLNIELDQQSIIEAAKQAIGQQFKRHSSVLKDIDKVKDFLLLNLAPNEREVFACLFLDNRNRLICYEELFYGSVSHSQVDAREVIKRALACNAAGVIAAHNHPSGDCKPSEQDKIMTHLLSAALQFSGIKLVDHFVVGGKQVLSMKEKGLYDPN